MTLKKQYLMNSVGKKTTSIYLLLLLICIGTAVAGLAQTFTTTVSANTIGKNQYAMVSYEISGANRIETFTAPTFKDWEVVSGPNNSSYSSSVNGTVTRRTAISYYLQPKKTGKLLIEGAKIVVDGRPMNSNSTIVEVLNKAVAEAAPSNNTSDPFGGLFDDPVFGQEPQQQAPTNFDDAPYLKAGADINKKVNEVLQLKVATSKNTCYQGEPIMATYKLYARVDVEVGFSKRPSFSGFSAFDMEEPNQSYVYEEVGGKKFKVYTIRKVQLYPLQNGTLTLDAVELDCKMRFIKYEAAASGNFDSYDNNNYVATSYTLKSPVININVLPLPAEGKPTNFTGAVGDFTIDSRTNTTDLGKDDAATLQVTINGSGNFSMVQAPAVQWPTGVEAYEPTEKENLVKSIMPIGGDKKFDYIFLTHQPGNLLLPAVSFSYFDVVTKKYKTIATKPITLQVAAESKRPKQNIDDSNANLPLLFVAVAKYVLPILAIGLVLYLLFSFLARKKRQQRQSEMQAMTDAWERMVNESPTPLETLFTADTPATTIVTQAQEDNHQYMPVAAPIVHQEEVAIQTITETVPTSNYGLPQAEAALWMPQHSIFFLSLKNDIMQALIVAANNNTANKAALFESLTLQGADSGVLQQLNSIMEECDAAIYSPVPTDTNRQKTMDEVRYLLGKLPSNA